MLRESDFLRKEGLGPSLMRIFLRKPTDSQGGDAEGDELNTSTQRLQPDEDEKVIKSKSKADTSGKLWSDSLYYHFFCDSKGITTWY